MPHRREQSSPTDTPEPHRDDSALTDGMQNILNFIQPHLVFLLFVAPLVHKFISSIFNTLCPEMF
jgi:hypothetical protein